MSRLTQRHSSFGTNGTSMVTGEPIGKFQVIEQLGEGAHSTILHVRRQSDSRHYALKVVRIDEKDDHKYLEQAQHEFRVAQLLEHPNLIKIHVLELAKDWLFRVKEARLLIEYVNGKTLDTIPRVIPVPQLLQVFAEVAQALVHMHRRNVFHADLKPNNIMLSKAGQVKVLDYGLATIKGEPKGRIQGTPEYMAPEQVRHCIVNERTDIYNLGATMYRMVTLRLPPSVMPEGSELTIDAKLHAQLLKPAAEFNPRAPAELCDLIHLCLEHNPNRRPERVSEVFGALDHLVDNYVKTEEDKLDNWEW